MSGKSVVLFTLPTILTVAGLTPPILVPAGIAILPSSPMLIALILSEKIELPETKISFTCKAFHLDPPVPPISYVSFADGIICLENFIAFSVVEEFQVTVVPETSDVYLEYVSSDIPFTLPVTEVPLTLREFTFTTLKLASLPEISPSPLISRLPCIFISLRDKSVF